MQKRYTLKLWRDDMGSFEQPGCTSQEDALWHVNSARAHDGLRVLKMETFQDMLTNPDSSASATFTLEN